MESNQQPMTEEPDVHAPAPGRWTGHLARADAAPLMRLGVCAVLGDLGDLDERHVVAVTTHFVAPATAGPVEITVGHIDCTSARATADARIRQSGRVVARLLLTAETGPDVDRCPSPDH